MENNGLPNVGNIGKLLKGTVKPETNNQGTQEAKQQSTQQKEKKTRKYKNVPIAFTVEEHKTFKMYCAMNDLNMGGVLKEYTFEIIKSETVEPQTDTTENSELTKAINIYFKPDEYKVFKVWCVNNMVTMQSVVRNYALKRLELN